MNHSRTPGMTSLRLFKAAVAVAFVVLVASSLSVTVAGQSTCPSGTSVTCPASVTNCAQCCSGTTGCFACNPDYQVDGEGNCQLTRCDPAMCQECEAGSYTKCKECNPGYEQLADAANCTKVVCTDSRCDLCEASDPSYCIVCLGNETYGNGKCEPSPMECHLFNCTKCVTGVNGEECEVCEEGFNITADRTCKVIGDGTSPAVMAICGGVYTVAAVLAVILSAAFW